MKEYEKVIDYKTNEAKYYKIVDGIMIVVSKDIIIEEYRKEIERLNHIINELEKYLKENYVIDNPIKFKNDLLDKLKELKEGEKNVKNKR